MYICIHVYGAGVSEHLVVQNVAAVLVPFLHAKYAFDIYTYIHIYIYFPFDIYIGLLWQKRPISDGKRDLFQNIVFCKMSGPCSKEREREEREREKERERERERE